MENKDVFTFTRNNDKFIYHIVRDKICSYIERSYTFTSSDGKVNDVTDYLILTADGEKFSLDKENYDRFVKWFENK